MSDLHSKGYIDALQKLGMTSSRAVTPPTPIQSGDPLVTGDDHMPAGELTATLAKLDIPDYGLRVKGKKSMGSPEERLNRDVQWSSAQDIPMDSMTGATTPIPGGGF